MKSLPAARLPFSAAALIAALLSCLTALSPATILTFEDFTANNTNLTAVANPAGAGQYGSRAAAAR